MSESPQLRVVVVGGGVVGLSIAWRCAARPGVDVTLVDPEPGRGASWVAGGMLAPVAEALDGEVATLKLGLESNRRYPAFVQELTEASGLDAGYTRQGTLLIARDADDAAAIARLHEFQQDLGLAAERVTSREARSLEPALAPGVRGGMWIADDHQIDNRLLVAALIEACRRARVRFVAAEAAAVSPREVLLASGERLACDRAVASTGAWPLPIDTASGRISLPVRPVKGQILRVRTTARAVFPTHTVRSLDAYMIPRSHGEIAIGATSEELGYDRSVTAGGVLGLLRSAWEIVPGIAEAVFVEAIAGLRPATPDNVPLIGVLGPRVTDQEHGEQAGVVVAMGHFRHGVLLSPVTADLVTALVCDGKVMGNEAALISPCRPDRFALTESTLERTR